MRVEVSEASGSNLPNSVITPNKRQQLPAEHDRPNRANQVEVFTEMRRIRHHHCNCAESSVCSKANCPEKVFALRSAGGMYHRTTSIVGVARTDSQVVQTALHGIVNVRGCARRQALADGDVVSAGKNHQMIGRQLCLTHAVQLLRIRGGIFEMPGLQDCLDRLNTVGRRSGSVEQNNRRRIVRCRWCAGRQSNRCDARDELDASAFHEMRATPNGQSEGGHAPRRSQPQRPAAVRCAWFVRAHAKHYSRPTWTTRRCLQRVRLSEARSRQSLQTTNRPRR